MTLLTFQSTGCFRGLLWPMMSAGLINSVFFGVYGFTLNWLGGDKHKGTEVGNIRHYACTPSM